MDSFAVRRLPVPLDDIVPLDASVTTVLLVTEDGDLRAAGARVLTREGYRVVTASHSGHALLASMTHGPIDILATELSMHEMSGPNLTDRLRRLHPDLQAIYFANSGTTECQGVLVRPFTRDDLLTQLQAAALSGTA